MNGAEVHLLYRAWDALFRVTPTPADVYDVGRAPGLDAMSRVMNYAHKSSALLLRDSGARSRLVDMLRSSTTTPEDPTREVASQEAAGACEPTPTTHNPLTGVHVPVGTFDTFRAWQDRKFEMRHGDLLRYALTHDTFFQAARLYGGLVVCVDPSSPESLGRDARLVDEVATAAAQAQRPLVLWASTEHAEADVRALLPQWDVHVVGDELMRAMPRVFARSITVACHVTASVKSTMRSVPALAGGADEALLVLGSADSVEAITRARQGFGRVICAGTSAALVTEAIPLERAVAESLFSTPPAPESAGPKGWEHALRAQLLQRHLARPPGAVDNAGLGFLAFSEFIARRCSRAAWFSSPPSSSSSPRTSRAIVAIDNRANAATVFAIKQTLACLEAGLWSLVVYTSPQHVAFYRAAMNDLGVSVDVDDRAPGLRLRGYGVEDYNVLLKSPWLWQDLLDRGYEQALLVQDDGMLVRPGLEVFGSTYDYVGAPWAAHWPCNQVLKDLTGGALTGNGGLSLRNIRAMLDVAESRKGGVFAMSPLQTEPEDVFFAAGVHASAGKWRLCPAEKARLFSSEEEMEEGSLGFHKPWPYHAHGVVARFFERALQVQDRVQDRVRDQVQMCKGSGREVCVLEKPARRLL